MGLFDNFEQYIWGIFGLYSSWEQMSKELGEKLMVLRQKPNLSEIMEITPNKLIPGRFYLIQYDFNGNFIWCPILALEYKVINNKHILYALNFEYLPTRYKIMLFNRIFKSSKEKMKLISSKEKVREESPMKWLDFEFMYKLLKANGNMTWALTAFTIKNFEGKFKIKKAYLCSVKITPEIMFCDLKKFNTVDMKKLHKTLQGEDQIKLSKIIEDYEKLIEQYQVDSIEYHKKLALFREKLKLFQD